jgi:hypothetical protein
MVRINFPLTRNLAQLGCDWNADHTREEAFKVWNVQFNAKPKENVVSIQ